MNVKNVKRKFPDIEYDIDRDLEDCNEEIKNAEKFLEKMKKKKMRLELERESLKM